MNNEIKQKMSDRIMELLDEADRLESGSEEQARVYKNIKLIWDSLTDEFKFSEELLDARHKLERDIALKEAEIKNEKHKRMDKLRDTLLVIVSIIGTSIFGAVMEVNGWRLPRWLTHFDKLWKFLKS